MQSGFFLMRNVCTGNLSNRICHILQTIMMQEIFACDQVTRCTTQSFVKTLLWMFEVGTTQNRASPPSPHYQCFRNCHERTSKWNGSILQSPQRFAVQPPKVEIMPVHVATHQVYAGILGQILRSVFRLGPCEEK